MMDGMEKDKSIRLKEETKRGQKQNIRHLEEIGGGDFSPLL
jgi:hypothetical protein